MRKMKNLNKIQRAKALLAYQEDIKRKSLVDWFLAHVSFLKPLHRYEGEIKLTNEKLIFQGKDKKNNSSHKLEISKEEIKEIYLGFDEVFKRSEDRSLGLTFKPLRITFEKNGKLKIAYFIINFKRITRTTDNKKWFELLERWKKDGMSIL